LFAVVECENICKKILNSATLVLKPILKCQSCHILKNPNFTVISCYLLHASAALLFWDWITVVVKCLYNSLKYHSYLFSFILLHLYTFLYWCFWFIFASACSVLLSRLSFSSMMFYSHRFLRFSYYLLLPEIVTVMIRKLL